MPELAQSELAELKIPARSEFIGLAKRVATSLGGHVGFSLDKIDELSIAVVQACGSAIEAAEDTWGEGTTLRLVFSAIEGGIEVEVESIPPRAQDVLPRRRPLPTRSRSAELEMERALVQEMIRLFVDDFRHQVDTGRRQIRYRMVKYLIS